MTTDTVNEGKISVINEMINAEIDDECNGKTDKGELEEQRVNRDDDRTPHVGMVFSSYGEAINFYKRYAMRVGFGVTIKKSSFTTYGLCRRLVLACTKEGKGRTNACYQSRPTAKTNCEAKLIAKLWGDGLLHVSEAKLEHNHELNPLAARSLSCYKRFPSGMAKDLAVRSAGRDDIPFSDNKFVNPVEGGALKLSEEDSESIFQFFGHMQTKNPNFFYLLDLDVEGQIRNVFWADSRCRSEYQYYGDVVYFDSSYVSNKFKIPLAFFVGTNNHGQSVLLGCGLLSDETADNYLWLFKSWLTCMLEKPPNAMVTEQSSAIRDAMAQAFPKVRHRICLSNIMRNIPENLRESTEWRTIQNTMDEVIYDSLKVDQFEEGWRALTKLHGLESNEWLNLLYDTRQLWAPVFLKDTFWAGLSITRFEETVNSFFEEFVSPETKLKDFLCVYEMVLQSKYQLQMQADFESCQLQISKFHMEEQVSQLYTFNIFSKFQDELKASVYCQVALVKIDGSVSTFDVKETVHRHTHERSHDKNYEVLYDVEDFDTHCICGYFQFTGILCRHALAVLNWKQIFEVPSKYILNRWRKDFKRLHAWDCLLKDAPGKKQMNKYDYLYSRCLQLAEFGGISDEKYQLALKLIGEVEKTLLDDNTCRELQRTVLPSETRLNEGEENQTTSQLGTLDSNKIPNATTAKRRGRPPKKRKESEIESTNGLNYTVDSMRVSSDAGHNNLLHASSASHLGSHDGTHAGVDLMEEVIPNDLSFGSHFGVHANQQHLDNQLQSSHTLQSQFGHPNVGSQTRMQWFYQQILQEDHVPFSRRAG